MESIHCGPNTTISRTEKIKFEVTGWSSLRCTPTVTIRPSAILVEYTGAGYAWVKVTGPRINASGLGATHDRPLWRNEWPEWLATEIYKRAPEWWRG